MITNNREAAMSFIKSIDAVKGEGWSENTEDLADAFVRYVNFIKRSAWHLMNEEPDGNVHVVVFTPTEIDAMKFRIVEGRFVQKCSDAILWSYIDEPEIG